MSWTVYRHTFPNGKVYIGITKSNPKKRWDGGRGYAHSPRMAKAIAEYGWENVGHDILEEHTSKAEAEAAEIAYIAQYQSNDPEHGYNTESGGSGRGKISDETRKKLSERMLGDKNPTRRFGHPFQGKHHSPEAKAKMSAAAKARVGRYCSIETRMKLRKVQQKKPVIDLTTGRVYAGIHEAAEATGTTATTICAVCRGKRKSDHGHRWQYYEKGQAAAIEALRLEIVGHE